MTPLLHAVCAGRLDAATLLLQRGAVVGDHSARMVESAANRGDEAMLDLLIAHGATANTLGAGGWVAHPAIADRLPALGANVNRTPGAWIGICCTGNSGHRENLALVRSMLRRGADITARYGGRTALHCAARAGFVNVAVCLIEHGGDVNALSATGATPLDEVETAAKSIDREPVRRLLRAHMARSPRAAGRDSLAAAAGEKEVDGES